MRTLFLILLCVSASLRSEAQLNIANPFYVAGVLKPAAASGASYLIKEDFEGPGYDLQEGGTAWLESNGSPYENPDDATNPLRGSQSLSMNKSNATFPQDYKYWKNDAGTNLSEFNVFFAFKTTSIGANNVIVHNHSNATDHAFVYLLSTGRLGIYDTDGSLVASPTDALSANTVYYIWSHWNFATGAADVEFSTTTTKAGSGSKYASGTGATSGKKANRISFLTTSTLTTNWFDYVRASTTTIGSAPE